MMCICDTCELCNETTLYEEVKFSDSLFADVYLREYSGYHCLYSGNEARTKAELCEGACRLR